MSKHHATRLVVVDPEQPDPTVLNMATAILKQGGLVAFATETVYGLGAIATDPSAVSRIFAAKARPAINPVIVHVATIEQAKQCVSEWPATAQTLAHRFWPGPLTLVLRRSAIIPDQVTAGHNTVGVALPPGRSHSASLSGPANPSRHPARISRIVFLQPAPNMCSPTSTVALT